MIRALDREAAGTTEPTHADPFAGASLPQGASLYKTTGHTITGKYVGETNFDAEKTKRRLMSGTSRFKFSI